MGKSIILHKTKGLNPRLTFCRRCGKDAEEIVLLGARDSKRVCTACGTVNYGMSAKEACGKCKHLLFDSVREPIGEFEKLPAHDFCDKCRKELKEWKEIVSEGGIYWKCKNGHTGVIRKSPFSDMIREKMKIVPPEPVGVELPERDCPGCKGVKETS